MQSLCEWWTWIIRINCQSLAEISCKFLGGSTRVVLTRLRIYTLTHVTWNISYFYLLIHLFSFNNRRSLYWEIYEESLQYVQCGLVEICVPCVERCEVWGAEVEAEGLAVIVVTELHVLVFLPASQAGQVDLEKITGHTGAVAPPHSPYTSR